MQQLLGAHMSVSGGVSNALIAAEKFGFNAVQIFTKNNNRWEAKPLETKEIDKFLKLSNEFGVKFILSHDSYLINLCAKDQETLEKSRASFIDEIERCALLNIPFLNFHPGTHGGQGVEEGIKIIAESINLAHDKTKNYKVGSMLEATAGQGSSVGHTFEQLAQIIELVEDKDRMSVCIDTAHIFAAGYDIRNAEVFDNTIKQFDKTIGLNRLKCFHVNDSKKEFGSKVDRHEHIGQGFIGAEAFRLLMTDTRLTHIPKIIETPKSDDDLMDVENINKLKSFIGMV